MYSNPQIIMEACVILLKKFDDLKHGIEHDEVTIIRSDNTLENCYDVILVNEDYTIGNILNYELFKIFYRDLKVINYVGFKKLHPHDTDSIIRISLEDKTKGISSIKTMIIAVIEEATKRIKGVQQLF
jgi:DNA-directed RNA polymerase subunit L